VKPRTYCIALLVAGLVGAPAGAQDRSLDSLTFDAALGRIQVQIPREQRVRVSASGERREGRVHQILETSVLFVSNRSTRLPPAARVDTMWVWKSHTGNGRIIGAVLLGAVGLMAGSSLEQGGYQNPYLVAGVTGASFGALFGMTIGAMSSGWRQRYPVP